MCKLKHLVILLLLLAPVQASAATYVVDPAGGGDFECLPKAIWLTSSRDTLLLVPGTYHVSPADSCGLFTWPITLNMDSPWVVGQQGAEHTEIVGDGETSAFRIWEGDAYIRFRGISFRGIRRLFERSCEYGECGGLMKLIDCVIEECGSQCALNAQWCLPQSCVISGCVIRNNTGCGICTYHYFGVIENCEICYNGGRGISGLCCETPRIRNNFIHHNGDYGVRCQWSYLVEDNIISDNAGAGVYIEGSSNVIGNVITGNEVGIYHNGFGGTITTNSIFGNDTYDFMFSSEAYSGDYDLTMNWWDTTIDSEIREAIWDCEDDPAVAPCAVIDPWCENPECEGTAVAPSSWGEIKALFMH